MKTYIINLPSAAERKTYMDNIIKQCDLIEPIFFEAVDGRTMTEEERRLSFDYDRSFKEYGRMLRNGEVGCTLSHYRIYKQIIDSKDKCAMIFEDDIEIISDINNDLLPVIKPYYDTDIPTVVLLSGKYEYYKLKKINNTYKIASVFDAHGTYGYIINDNAAGIIMNEKPFWCADDWWYFRSKGVNVFGIKPHYVEPLSREVMPSYVQTNNISDNGYIRKNMSVFKAIKSYYRFGIRKMLRFVGLCEPEYRRY